jgi:hypothetical protein
MNVEIGTEAAQFPEKDYINGIFLAAFNSLFFKPQRSQLYCVKSGHNLVGTFAACCFLLSEEELRKTRAIDKNFTK